MAHSGVFPDLIQYPYEPFSFQGGVMETLYLPDAFYHSLDESPDDATTLSALADWYEERGDTDRAACVRWTIRRGIHPVRFVRDNAQAVTVRGVSWRDAWYWWVIDERNWAEVRACRLPPKLWNRLAHSFPYEPGVFKDFPTRRAAYEALFEAWPLFAPRHRVARKWEVAR